MSAAKVMRAVAERVERDGLSARDIGALYLALPSRALRSEDERNVAAGLSLAFKRKMRELLADIPTPDLLTMQDATTDAEGAYLDGGDGLDSPTNLAIEDVLEMRYNGDSWQAWEVSAEYLPISDPGSGAACKAFSRAYWLSKAKEGGTQ